MSDNESESDTYQRSPGSATRAYLHPRDVKYMSLSEYASYNNTLANADLIRQTQKLVSDQKAEIRQLRGLVTEMKAQLTDFTTKTNRLLENLGVQSENHG